jgi:hypothetical protein
LSSHKKIFLELSRDDSTIDDLVPMLICVDSAVVLPRSSDRLLSMVNYLQW